MKSREAWSVVSEQLFPKGDNPLGNKFYGYRATNLDLPNGKKATYHGVDVGPCVHIVAVTDDGTTFLVRQSRPNARQNGQLEVPVTLELPGGFADQVDENGKVSLLGSASEELRTEVGLRANLRQIGQLYPSPGVSNEIDTVFLGTSAEVIDGILERVEVTEADMRILAAPFGQMYDSLRRSEIPVAAQTLAAMSMAAVHL